MKVKKVYLYILTISLIVILVACSNTPDNLIGLTQEEKIEDFDYLYEVLKGNYPMFGVARRQYHIDWLSQKERYLKKIKKCNSDVEFANEIKNIIGELHGLGHIDVIDPIMFEYMYDVYGSLDQAFNYHLWVGTLSDKEVIQNYRKWKVMFGLDDINYQHTINVTNSVNVFTEIDDENKIGYLKIKSFNHFYMEQNEPKIIDFLDQVKEYDYLIIDIRGNTGGDSRFWSDIIVKNTINSPLVSENIIVHKAGELNQLYYEDIYGKSMEEQLKSVKELPEELNYPQEVIEEFDYFETLTNIINPSEKTNSFKGKIYLLIDVYNYSSAEGFAIFCKNTGWATLIGRPTSGDGIGSDPYVFSLPNSKLIIRYTGYMGLNSDGTCNEECGTIPDIIISKYKDAKKFIYELIEEKQ